MTDRDLPEAIPLADRPSGGARQSVFDIPSPATSETGSAPQQPGAEASIETLIILPVRDFVLFPGTVFPIALGRAGSIAAAQQAVREEKQIGILMQRDASKQEPSAADFHSFGTIANVLRYISTPDGQHHVVVQGESRFQIEEFLHEQPFVRARVRLVVEPEQRSSDIEARFMNLKHMALEALQLLPQAPADLVGAVQGATSPSQLTDLVAAYLDFEAEKKQELIETIDPVARIDKVTTILAHRLEVLRLTAEIGRQTKATFDDRQKEAVLREQMAAIQKQLGEGDAGRAQEVADLTDAIGKAGMPLDAETAARKELRRYERSSDASPESGMIRNHLDWMVELPWALADEKPIDVPEARRILDEDHFGLAKIKSRIVEYLAVRKLAPNGKAPILCFAGPPGVGKTSLGQSIARAMGRPFVRVSLGGVHDEAEIRGHRSTYIGALPGNIIQGLRKAGARNCVMMLDEIDKMGRGAQGDPSAAMLEVLDPEQNATFRDNYIGTPFDLSRVVFIATANMLDTIPGPLRDRMEIIQLAGYTQAEKLEIARRYLLDRQRRANGLSAETVEVPDETLRTIIGSYTRESGVRNLEREIGAVLRHAAVRIAEGTDTHVTVRPEDLAKILGGTRFESEVSMRTGLPGVATGLAWTPVGGEILFIEATRSQGRGGLTLTGQLGDVMKESAQIALSLVRNRSASLGIDPKTLEGADIHVHVPAGATPKDGPSAGVAMTMALVSLLTGRPVRHDTAMTGEVSLRGLVMPVGGIKEKVLAAAAAGITRVLLPARNRRDYDDIPEDVRNALEFVWLERIDEAVEAGLEARDSESFTAADRGH
ncbi:MAG: endopeptidase La [Janthinobacterium lividum]